MVAEENTSSRREGTRESNATRNGEEAEFLFARTRAELTNLFDSLKRTAFVEWQRVRLRAIDAFFRGAFFLCVLLFLLAGAFSAALLVVSGFRGALQAWSGVEWVGDLAGGTLAIAAMSFGALALRARLRSKLLVRTEAGLAGGLARKQETGS